MEPELQPTLPEAPKQEKAAAAEDLSARFLPFHGRAMEPDSSSPDEEVYRGLHWIFVGAEGLRAGWSVLMFVFLAILFLIVLGTAVTAFVRQVLHVKAGGLTPAGALISETISVLAILGAGALMALIERRRILDYNLAGPRRLVHFFSGVAAGFAALSALVGALAWGGWLHFGPVTLSGGQILSYAPQSAA